MVRARRRLDGAPRGGGAVSDAAGRAIPPFFNFTADVVEARAERADKLALVHCDETGAVRRHDFSDIARAARALAAGLSEQGVSKGDRIIVMFPRRPEWQIAMLAALRIGAVPVPCIESLAARDIAYRVRHAGARAAITMARNTPKFAPVAELLETRIALGEAPGWLPFAALADPRDADRAPPPARIASEDPAILYYTSGSTGLPKGVLHAARALYAWRGSARDWLDLGSGDLIWCTADTGWSKAGTSILFGPWSVGSAVFMSERPFDPADRLATLQAHDITVYCAAATELLRVANSGLAEARLASLRRVVSAGEAVNPVVADRWREATGIMPAEAYGQTETLMTILTPPGETPRAGSMGRAAPGCTVAVLDEQGARCPPGAVGQIAVRSPDPQLMIGYLDDPERTAASYLDTGDGRWFLTGDLATRDEEGWFRYIGRDDDIINTSGYRVGPFEVENVLLEHEAVAECAVVGAPDAERGEIVTAYIVPAAGAEPGGALVEAIQAFAKSATAPYKYPRRIVFVDALPKTPTGKIRRGELRRPGG